MALSTTTKKMRGLLAELAIDLEKAAGGNKAAAQRVRVGTVTLEKLAKLYRKESVADEKKAPKKKPAKKKPAKKVAKKVAKKKPVKKVVKKKAPVKKIVKKKPVKKVVKKKKK
jgi:hypothetical protein